MILGDDQMLYTSSYASYDPQNTEFTYYSISGDRGKRVGYKGPYYRELAPKMAFWQIWHNNIGKIPADENDRFYVLEYYWQVLSPLDPEKVYGELSNEATLLLCYEPHDVFCHRHIPAVWLELTIGIEVPEVILRNGRLTIVSRPLWIKEELQSIMQNINH